jgi:hypothetical protein
VNSDPSPQIIDSPVRWTYDGTMDDMVVSYPWPGIPVSKARKSLDAQLVYSVVTGTPMLLNDGYLVFNPVCFESLREPYSPLRVLIRERYIRVLSRNPKSSLEQMVRDGAKEGIRNRVDLRKDDDRWRDAQNVLSTADEELRNTSRFFEWPKVNLSRSYQQLIRFLMGLSPDELWKDGVPFAAFRRVAERFDNEMSKEAIKPRSKWEEIVKDEAETEAEISALMHLANEVYHHNFGAALASHPPAGIEGAEIAVQSRISQAFSGLYKSHALGLDPPARVLSEVVLPDGLDYSKGALLSGLFDENQSVGSCRASYLRLRAEYRDGRVGCEEMSDAKDEYQKRLDEYLLAFFPRAEATTSAAKVALGGGVAWLTYLTTSLLGPTIILGVLGGCLAELVVPKIMETWQVFGNLEYAAKLKLTDWRKRASGRKLLTSLVVDPNEATKLVGSVPKFT